MTENAKTMLCGGLAVLVAVIAFFVSRPAESAQDAQSQLGKPLYPEFTDPLAATSLAIYTYDKDTAEPKSFNVELNKGRWVIPSQENYPTDAKERLGDVAASVYNLKILDIKTESANDHAQYGVIDPDPKLKEVKAGGEGVGIKVAIHGKDGRPLMRLIIGKEDKSTDAAATKLHYVRREKEDVVFLAAVDTSKLSTKFSDWIEPDLLKVNYWDVKSIVLDNYSVDETQGVLIPGDRLDLTYDDAATEKRWKLADLAEGEELDETKLNDLRDALDDLRIVDVYRKPAGLSADLKAADPENPQKTIENMLSLQNRGFFMSRTELFANEGKVSVGTKEGIEYSLLFGEIAAGSEDDVDTAQEKVGDGNAKASSGQNRYLMIAARFNPELIPAPELKPLPGEAQPAPPPAPVAGEAPANGTAEGAGETPAPAASAADTGAASPAPEDGGCQEAVPAAGAGDSAETEDEAPAPPSAPQHPAEGDTTAPPAQPTADAAAKAPDQVALDAERERIKAENKRLQDAHDQKVKDGEKKAKELNDRFADWYYVISDDIFKKIHVSRADILKKTDPVSTGENPLKDFEDLKSALPTQGAGAAAADSTSDDGAQPDAATDAK